MHVLVSNKYNKSNGAVTPWRFRQHYADVWKFLIEMWTFFQCWAYT